MASAQKPQPQVVAIPVPAQGHLNPLMRFCKTLASHGLHITFVNIDPVHHRIADCRRYQHLPTALHHADDQPPRIHTAHVPIHGLDFSNDFRISLEHFFNATDSLAAAVEQLIERLSKEGTPVTCLISDVLLSTATQKVADKFNIPRIALFPSSQSANLFWLYLCNGQIQAKDALEVVLKLDKPANIFKDSIPGLPSLRNQDLPRFKHVSNDNEYMYPFLIREVEIAYEKAHTIVLNSFEELEGPAFEAMRKQTQLKICPVGPLIEELTDESSTSLWKEDDDCLQWLQSQPPRSVLYISFGSVTLLSKLQFEEVLSGLAASNQRFLWAFRPDLVEGAPYSSIPEDFLSKTKGRGCVVNWAPQLRVLSHPSVGGFLTHCGWNSTVEGIANGIPMLCWPYFADQFLDAKYIVEEWKVGLRFNAREGEDVVGREEIERTIRNLMEAEEGKKLRKNATTLRDAGRRSLQAGGSSHCNIQALVQTLSQHS